jgi:hypothetical protein
MVNELNKMDIRANRSNTTQPKQWKVIGKSYVNEPLKFEPLKFDPLQTIKVSPLFSPDGGEYIITNFYNFKKLKPF